MSIYSGDEDAGDEITSGLEMGCPHDPACPDCGPVRTRCCICKGLIHEGRLIDGLESHGHCPPCDAQWRIENGVKPRKG